MKVPLERSNIRKFLIETGIIETSIGLVPAKSIRLNLCGIDSNFSSCLNLSFR